MNKNEEFISKMENLLWDNVNLTENKIVIAKEDFLEFIRIAKLGLIPHDCICTADQYGSAVNPECKIHGDSWRGVNKNEIKNLTFQEIQKNIVEWNKKNFGGHFGSGYRNLLGISEEVEELCHAQLKGEQGIRHSPEEIRKMKIDAIGDIVIFLCNYCDSQEISLEFAVESAWNEIKNRDWWKRFNSGKNIDGLV